MKSLIESSDNYWNEPWVSLGLISEVYLISIQRETETERKRQRERDKEKYQSNINLENYS